MGKEISHTRMTQTEMTHLVDRMHRLMMQPAHSEPRDDISADEFYFRSGLIISETHETLKAMATCDVRKFVDGLCDIAVVCMGTKVQFGLVEQRRTEAKGKEYFGWEISNMILYIMTDVMPDENEDVSSDHVGHLVSMCDKVIEMFFDLFDNRPDLHLSHNFRHVMEANFAKTVSDLETAEREVEIKRNEGVDCDFAYNEEMQCYVILRADGKFLKPSTWQEPEPNFVIDDYEEE